MEFSASSKLLPFCFFVFFFFFDSGCSCCLSFSVTVRGVPSRTSLGSSPLATPGLVSLSCVSAVSNISRFTGLVPSPMFFGISLPSGFSSTWTWSTT
uniref:Putative secreted protein n=1 Tax=Ixodes ricinus TaxID=34613 RepID=A0A6B0UDI0_IXORI